MAQLTEQLKVQVRGHMGYVNVQAVATFALGTPAALETQFMIETAMNKILPGAVPEVERLVGILDGLEGQMVDDAELAAVNQVGEIAINQGEQQQLRRQYNYFLGKLENLLGVPRNPFDKRFAVNSVNVPVYG